MSEYESFKEEVAKGTNIPHYYLKLITHTKEILLDISMRNQNRVAKDLGLTSVKFSHLLPMLKEIYTSSLSNQDAEEPTNANIS